MLNESKHNVEAKFLRDLSPILSRTVEQYIVLDVYATLENFLPIIPTLLSTSCLYANFFIPTNSANMDLQARN